MVAEGERGFDVLDVVVNEHALVRSEAERVGRVVVHPRVGFGAAQHGGDRVRVEVAREADTVVELRKLGPTQSKSTALTATPCTLAFSCTGGLLSVAWGVDARVERTRRPPWRGDRRRGRR